MADAIILAGGLGTRLREAVPDRPKPLAPIQGVAFLDLLLDQLERSGVIDQIILAIGYKAETIVDHYHKQNRKVPIVFSVEEKPLGTGGAIKRALALTQTSPLFVLNGDSYLSCSLDKMLQDFRFPASLAYTHVENASRYGQIEIDSSERITAFREKDQTDRPGWINGGIYLFDRSIFESRPEVFSLEKDLLPALLVDGGVFGFRATDLFIDIGTPASFAAAQNLLKPLIHE